MHLLHLLRHAKSSWREDIDDHDRRLSRRGRDSARLVAADLARAAPGLDLVLCSSAQRTRETLALVLAGFPASPPTAIEDELYLASPARLMRRLQRLPETAGEVLLIGHNPGLHELAVTLALPRSAGYAPLVADRLPTACRASLRIDGAWAGLDRVRHGLAAYVTAASLGGRDD